MSTDFGKIKAKIETSKRGIGNIPEISYIDTNVSLRRFYGGEKRGTSLQLTFLDEQDEFKHIQLDSKSIKKLKAILNNSFDDDFKKQ